MIRQSACAGWSLFFFFLVLSWPPRVVPLKRRKDLRPIHARPTLSKLTCPTVTIWLPCRRLYLFSQPRSWHFQLQYGYVFRRRHVCSFPHEFACWSQSSGGYVSAWCQNINIGWLIHVIIMAYFRSYYCWLWHLDDLLGHARSHRARDVRTHTKDTALAIASDYRIRNRSYLPLGAMCSTSRSPTGYFHTQQLILEILFNASPVPFVFSCFSFWCSFIC